MKPKPKPTLKAARKTFVAERIASDTDVAIDAAKIARDAARKALDCAHKSFDCAYQAYYAALANKK